jgi:hypothetical protein
MIDLIVTALSRLTNQFNESPKLRAMVEAMIRPLQEAVEDAAALKEERWLDTAIGQQLDGLGYLVGVARDGRNDEDYRAAIAFKIFVNTSNATPGDLIQALRTLTQGTDIQYIEQYPATAELFTDGPIVPFGLQDTMQGLAPAAISDVPIKVSYARAEPFRFSKAIADNYLNVGPDTRLTANGNRLKVSGSTPDEDAPTLAGVAPSYLVVTGGPRLAISGGMRLVVQDPNTQTIIGGDYHLTGLYQ